MRLRHDRDESAAEAPNAPGGAASGVSDADDATLAPSPPRAADDTASTQHLTFSPADAAALAAALAASLPATARPNRDAGATPSDGAHVEDPFPDLDPEATIRPAAALGVGSGVERAAAPPRAKPPAPARALAPRPSTPAPAATAAAGPLPRTGPGTDVVVLHELDRGGMGAIYVAEQPALRRQVALKALLHPDDADARRQFVAEAIVTARLDHPNVVSVHDLGEGPDGAPYMTMKLVRGTSWRAMLRAERGTESARSVRDHLEVLLKVCDAVAFAHARGVLHRDLKPANVMVGAFGEVLVMDWGLALELAPEGRRAADLDGPAGTPRYMPPELALGDVSKMRPATDVYLLGAILYEILTGTPPHRGQGPLAVLRAAVLGEIEPPARRAPERTIPAPLAAIALTALAAEPARRHASVAAFAEAVRTYLTNEASLQLAQLAEAALDRLEETADERAAGPTSGPTSESMSTSADASATATSAPLRAAEVYAALGSALAELQQSLKLWPENATASAAVDRAHLVYARYAAGQGDLGVAEAHLALASDTAPGYERASALVEDLRAARARAARRRRRIGALVAASFLVIVSVGGWRLAQEMDQRARAEEAKARRERAVAFAESIDYGNAENRFGAYHRALEEDPTWSDAHTNLAWAHVLRAYYDVGCEPVAVAQDLERALEQIAHAIAIDGPTARLRFDRAYLLEAQGEGERALEELRGLAQDEPASAHAAFARGALALVAGRFAEAEVHMTQALDEGVSTEDLTHLQRGFARLARGAVDEAIEDIERSLYFVSIDASFRGALAVALLAKGEHRRAGEEIVTGLRTGRAAPHLYGALTALAALRGDLAAARGLHAHARAERERCRRVFLYWTLWGALARLPAPHDRLGQVVALAADPDVLVPAAPPSDLPLRERGEAHFANGEIELALACAQRVLAENPADGLARLLRARCLRALGQGESALADLELVRLLAPAAAAEAAREVEAIEAAEAAKTPRR